MVRFSKWWILVAIGLMILAQPACFLPASQQTPASGMPVLVASPDKLAFTLAPGSGTTVQQGLAVVNKGTGDLNWVISDNQPWIMVQQSAGSSGPAGGGVNIVIDAKGLSAGQYTGVVTISSQGALNSPIYVPVFLTVPPSAGSTPPAPPAPPTAPSAAPGVSTSKVPPSESAAAWNNQTELYRYAGAYACIVSGSVANTDAIWYMGDVQIVTKSGSSTTISDSIAPGEQVTYHRYLPCYDNEVVRLSYRWYRP